MVFYNVGFMGRRVGAIGDTYPVVMVVSFEVEPPPEILADAVRLRLYDTHEHIGTVRIVPDTVCPDGPSCPDETCRAERVKRRLLVTE